MSHHNKPSTSPRRSNSAFMSPTPPLSTSPRGRAESSASSSDSSWTIQTPQSPSIMAVLDLGRKRAGSNPVMGHGNYELFENSLSHRESSASIRNHGQDETNPSPRRQTLYGPHSFNLVEPMSPQRQGVHASGHINSQAEIPSVEHRIAQSSEDLRDVADNARPSTQYVSRSKRAIPRSQPLDGSPAEQSDDSGAKQGRRLRPRLRAILTAPLASSRNSSRASLAKLAGALSSQKPSVESDLHTAVNQSRTELYARQDSQLDGPATQSGSVSTRCNEDTIWIQTKAHSPPALGANPPKSPIPANRSIPPTLQRGITSPTPALSQLSDSVAMRDSPPRPRLDHFERILPSELQVMIMSKLLESGASEERDRRWSGIVGTRRELIRLSRVSESWRRLCFDGQLWADVDLTPYAAYLHPRTIRHILNHTAPFISNLSLGRISAFSSSDILSSLANSGSPHAMATLTTLDLRCSKLDSRAIIAIIQNAPRLRAINLKGVQSVTPEILHHLATCCKNLHSLDLSGCWNVYIDDVRSYIETLDEKAAAGFNALRLNGFYYRNEGLIPADYTLNPLFDGLYNLETLSLQKCQHITSRILIRAFEALHHLSRTSTIRHLNLSRCTGLRADIFPAMSGLFPELRYLELAGMPRLFQENSQSDRTAFNRFLETLPKLEKLDVEETCGTCLDDSTLRILASAPNLTHLQIGFASKITPGAMIEFIRDCPTLRVFEADNTQANGAVIREFQYRHPEDGELSLIDCRAISAADYLRVAGISRPRDGFTGYAAMPMGYSPSDLQKKVVVKAFWSWRRVEIARGWRETLAEKERELVQSGTEAGLLGGSKGGRAGRGRGWRRRDDSYDAKGLCVVQ